MIDIRKLKELVRLMVSNDLTELDLRDSEEQVTLRRAGIHVQPQVYAAPVAAAPPPAHAPAAQQTGAAAGAPVAGGAAEEEGLIRIESPMVGTFYSSPNPDSPAFVEVGQKINSETVVCIIEAMKIFNEIKAECSGTVQRVLAKSGQAVEFGQPLFLVKPD